MTAIIVWTTADGQRRQSKQGIGDLGNVLPRELRARFPNCSEAFIAANSRATVEANRALCPAKSEQSARSLVETAEGETQGGVRPHVRFICVRRRSLDDDNLQASIKDLLDGLKYAHLIVDDSPKHITLEVTQVKPMFGEECTVIEIYYK